MRISSIDLIRWGHFRNQRIDLSRPGARLHVVIGPNEAGKSTALRAVRALLFGITRDNTVALSAQQAELQGALSLGIDQLSIARIGTERLPRVLGGGDGGQLAQWLDGITAELFEALFCLGHQELREQGDALVQTGGELGRLLFAAQLGADVLRPLRKKAQEAHGELLSNRANGRGAINAALREIEGLRTERDQATVAGPVVEQRRHELEESVAVLATHEERLRRLLAQRVGIQQLLNALPDLERWREQDAKLKALQANGALPGGDWSERLARAIDDRNAHERETSRLQGELGDKDTRLSSLAAPSPLPDASEAIGRLVARTGEVSTAFRNLPGERSRLEEIDAELRRLVTSIGLIPATDVRAQAVAALPSREAIAEVTALREQYADLQVKWSNDTTRLERMTARRKQMQEEWARHAEPAPIPSLEQALQIALGLGTIERDLVDLRRALVERERVTADQRARLSLAPHDWPAIEQLAVPARGRVEHELEQRRDLADSRQKLKLEKEATQERRTRLQGDRAELSAQGAPPSAEALSAARRKRDEGWRLIEAAWRAGTPESAEKLRTWSEGTDAARAFEMALQHADHIVDARCIAAHHVARMAQLDREELVLRVEEEQRAGRAKELDEIESKLDSGWQEAWRGSGITAPSWSAARDWLNALDQLRQAIAHFRLQQQQVGEKEQRRDEALTRLRGALVALGRGTADTLSGLIDEARDVVADRDQRMRLWSGATAALKHAEDEHRTAQQDVNQGEIALRGWSAQWSPLMPTIGLAPGASVAAALARLATLEELRSASDGFARVQRECDRLQRIVSVFAADTQQILATHAPDLVQRDAVDAVNELNRRLNAAIEVRVARASLERDRARIELEWKRVSAAQTRAEEQVSLLCAEAGLALTAELPSEIQRARDLAAATKAKDDARVRILTMTKRPSLEAVESELAALSCTPAEMGDRLDRELDEAQRAVQAAVLVRKEKQDALDRIDGSAKAAEAAQKIQMRLSAIRDNAEAFAIEFASEWLLNRVFEKLTRHAQGDSLKRASELFALLTRDAFAGLDTQHDDDRVLIIARRSNGERLLVEQLSDGTRDQLWLALRLMGIEHHVTTRGPVPVVLDDLLVHFDDGRSRATLQVLGELAEQTQVLMFTHHDHVAQLALDVLGPDLVNVIPLPPRAADAPILPSGSDELMPPRRPRPEAPRRSPPPIAAVPASVPDDASDVAQRIIAAVRASPGSGRQTIIEIAGITEQAWTREISALVDGRLVRREGERKGARYFPPAP